MTLDEFQSTRPLRGATDGQEVLTMEQSISIHAPLAGRDGGGSNGPHKKKISIHAPLAGRDGREQRHDPQVAHFNPRAPCGARPRCAAVGTRSFRFQSTRPLRGATVTITPTRHVRAAFQSTRPLRGATSVGVRVIRPRNYFNPRAPCGARQNTAGITAMHEWNFNPRAPCGARPQGCCDKGVSRFYISIHAPLAGRD